MGPIFMMTYEASHGTSKKRAAQIQNTGFKIKSGRNRYGAGIYLWKKSYHYVNLAIGWFKQSHAEGWYHEESNPICSVIIANLKAEKDEILDLEDDLFKDRLAKLAEARKINGKDWKKISALIESLVQIIQGDLGKNYKIVLKKASPPQPEYCPEYPFWVLGWPDCCIVRDASCIELKEIR